MSSVVPDGWSRQKLGDSLIPRPKSKLPSGESNSLGYYDFYVCSHKVLKSFHNEYSSPSILFSTGGEASVHFATERYAFSTDVWATEFEGDICNEYVFRLLEENNRTINYSGFQGSGIKHLDKSFIEKLEFSIPPLPEQKKIASILTSVDEVIENTSRQIDKLQDLKKATMNELLTKGIGHTEFKDSELGRIPKSWDVRTLGVVCQKIQDGTHFSPTTGGGSYKYLTSKNIRMGKLSLSKIETISESQHREIYKRCDVKFGDILLTKDGANTGNVAINILEEEFSLLSSVAFIRPSESAQTHFLLQYLMSDTAQSLMSELMSGNAITRLTLQKIKAFPLPLPPASEQTDIYLPLTAIDKQSLNLEAKKRQTQSLKKSLMQDLLTGKVRVTVN